MPSPWTPAFVFLVLTLGSALAGQGQNQPFQYPAQPNGVIVTIPQGRGNVIILPDNTSRNILQRDVMWLASEEREGRFTGSPGARATAQWLAEYFKSLGLRPFSGGYFLPFEFSSGTRVIPQGNRLDIIPDSPAAATRFDLGADCIKPYPYSENGEAEGEVLFAGYGLSVFDGAGVDCNSYEGLDAKGKIVLIFRDIPDQFYAKPGALINPHTSIRYRALLARERGARALLVAAAPNSPAAGESIPFNGAGTLARSGIPVFFVSNKVVSALLEPSHKTLAELQAALAKNSPGRTGFLLPKVKVHLSSEIEQQKETDNNVVAFLPPFSGTRVIQGRGIASPVEAGPNGASGDIAGNAASQSGSNDEYILIGAHYDHLGRGPFGSLQRSGEENRIHPGADDNASGVAWLLQLAALLARDRSEHPEIFKRGVIFACWSGEEIGLVGSRAFCEHPPVPLKSIAAYVNADMVGRLRENKLALEGVGSSKAWRELISQCSASAFFNLEFRNDPYLPTDVNSLYPNEIPVLNLFTGWHPDYHRPTDIADRINYDGLELIARFGHQIVLNLIQLPSRPEFTKLAKSADSRILVENAPPYLGVILDNTMDRSQAVKIIGVRAGSPAEKGGLKSGDVIVKLGTQTVAAIDDYISVLDKAKTGSSLEVTVEREGMSKQLTVTPQ